MTGALAKPPRAVADPAGGREYDLSLYDIAYLRGGTRELLKLRLLERTALGRHTREPRSAPRDGQISDQGIHRATHGARGP